MLPVMPRLALHHCNYLYEQAIKLDPQFALARAAFWRSIEQFMGGATIQQLTHLGRLSGHEAR